MRHSAAHPRHLIVLGHPAPGSFNHAVANAYCDAIQSCGQDCEIRDLNALGFDPVLKAMERPSVDFEPAADVEIELERIANADVIVLVFPLWFGMPPAIIKGYVDRVMGAGFGASGIRDGKENPPLAGKRLVIFSSSATTLPWLSERGQLLSLTQAFDEYLATIFGMASHQHVHLDAIVPGLEKRFVEEALERVRDKAYRVAAEALSQRHAEHTKAVMEAAK
jgi:NAD(P)H dehydrogenase (quinone)